jgi:hypothetical protein
LYIVIKLTNYNIYLSSIFEDIISTIFTIYKITTAHTFTAVPLPLQILNVTQVPTTTTLGFLSLYLYTLWLQGNRGSFVYETSTCMKM